MTDWNDGSVKGIEDFCPAIWAGTDGITPDFALGYAQALADCGEIERGKLAMWAAHICDAGFAHNVDFGGDERQVPRNACLPDLTLRGRLVGWLLWHINGFSDCKSCGDLVFSHPGTTNANRTLRSYWVVRAMREEANESR